MKKFSLALCIFLLIPIAMVCAGAGTEGATSAGDEIIEISVAKSEHPAQPIMPDAPAHLAITEKLNIKLNFIVMPSDDYTAKLKIWMATNQVPDLASAGIAEVRDYGDSGVILPFSPLVDKYAPNIKRYLEDTPEIGKLKAHGDWFFVPTQYFNRKVVASYPMIRTDVLEDLKLDTPTDWDELYEVLKAFKKAYPDNLVWANRNGTKRLLSLIAFPS